MQLSRSSVPVSLLLYAFAVVYLLFGMPDQARGQAEWQDAVAPMESGDYQTAEALMVAYLERQPTFAEGFTLLGVCRFKQGKYDLARQALTQATELGDSSFQPVQFLSIIDLKETLARAAIDRLSRFDPQPLDSSGRAMRAHLLLAASDLEKRSSNFRSAYDSAVTALETHQLRIDLQLLGESTAAGAALGLADELSANQSASEATVTEWLENGLAATTSHAQRDLEKHPEMAARLLQTTGQLRQRLGQGSRACVDFEASLTLSTSDSAARRAISCYSRLNDWPATRVAAERSLVLLAGKADSSDEAAIREVRGQLARALHHLEQYDEAIASYRLAGLENEAATLESAVVQRRAQAADEARCKDLKTKGERRLAETAWQKGSPEWMLLKKEIQHSLGGCEGLRLVHN